VLDPNSLRTQRVLTPRAQRLIAFLHFIRNSCDLKIGCRVDTFYFQIKILTVVTENEITELIIGTAIKVHKTLGPGLLESAYESCLYYEIFQSGLFVERQKAIPLIYAEVKLDCGYRADLVIESKVVVEVKAVESLNEIHLMQTLTHLRLLDVRVGLLINFNVLRLKAGLKRVVNNFRE
jgi:GxxExxY protein